MSVEQNKANERRFIEEVINKGNIEKMPEFIAANYIYHLPGNELKGTEGLKQILSIYKVALPDLQYKIENMVGEGDLLAVFCTVSGTLKGAFMGTPPTNKRMVLPAALLTRWEGGKEVEAWPYSDSLSMYRQLGIPLPKE